MVDLLQRLAIWLLPSLVAASLQVDLGVELHSRGIFLQLSHPSEFPQNFIFPSSTEGVAVPPRRHCRIALLSKPTLTSVAESPVTESCREIMRTSNPPDPLYVSSTPARFSGSKNTPLLAARLCLGLAHSLWYRFARGVFHPVRVGLLEVGLAAVCADQQSLAVRTNLHLAVHGAAKGEKGLLCPFV